MRLCRGTQTLFEVSWETEGPILVATVILGFLSIFKKSQAMSPFEALNSTCLSRVHRDVRPHLAYFTLYNGLQFHPSH